MSLPRDRFAARLAAAPLLADGGMGTLLFSRGIPQRACLDELATTRSDLVAALHREYLDAGADLIETVTFGANRMRLDGVRPGRPRPAVQPPRRPGRPRGARRQRPRRLGRRQHRAARRADPRAPPPDEAAIRAAFREQIDGLLEGGADLLRPRDVLRPRAPAARGRRGPPRGRRPGRSRR